MVSHLLHKLKEFLLLTLIQCQRYNNSITINATYYHGLKDHLFALPVHSPSVYLCLSAPCSLHPTTSAAAPHLQLFLGL
jgi:hypothetical protein